MNTLPLTYYRSIFEAFDPEMDELETHEVDKVELDTPVNFTTFSASQQQGCRLMHDYVRDKLVDENKRPYDFLVIEGQAGTGKTWMLGTYLHFLMQQIQKTKVNKRVCVAAPTRTAVKVAKANCRFAIPYGLSYKTSQSICGFRKLAGTADEFVYVPGKEYLTLYDLIIMDEASMIQCEMWDLICRYAGKVKIIFIGDSGQLPPVNEKISEVFNTDYDQVEENGEVKLTIQRFTMEGIQRTSENNPVLDLALAIRNKTTIPREVDKITEDGFLLYLPKEWGDKDELVNGFLRRAFDNDMYRKNPDYFKILVYTVKAKNNGYTKWTRRVRKALYPEKVDPVSGYLPDILEGEDLFVMEDFCQYFYDENKGDVLRPVIDKDQVVKVLQIRRTEMEVDMDAYEEHPGNPGGLTVHCYEMEIGYEDINTKTQVRKIVHYITKESRKVFDEWVSYCWKWARKVKQEGESMRPIIDQIDHYTKATFLSCRHNYVRTIHTSQGSSFFYTMEILPDVRRIIRKGKHRKESLDLYGKARYTDQTRSRIGNWIYRE